MDQQAAMDYFIKHVPDIEGIGIHHQLHENGTAGEVFKALGSAELMIMPPKDAQYLELPAYGDGFGVEHGEGHWWQPGCYPLRVRDWTTQMAYPDPKSLPGPKFKHWANPDNLASAGPSVAISDTFFGVTVLVDGCHRALMHMLLGQDVPVVVYKSWYAHLLIFPSHFVNHAIEAAARDRPR